MAKPAVTMSKRWPGVLAAATALFVSGNAAAGGFFLQEQSVRASGRAFAGEAAIADGASTIFSNPAGMTRLGSPRAETGAFLIIPRARLSDRGSAVAVGGGPGVPVAGRSSGQGFFAQPIGHGFVAAPVTPELWIGIGATVPFGLRSKYRRDYFGRYDSIETDVRTYDFAPSVAYAFGPRLSIGGSVNIQRASAKLVNAIPHPMAPGDPASDGRFSVRGNDWSVGFVAGVLATPADGLRIGLSYRSAISHTMRGKATTRFAGATTVQGVSANLDLPDIATLGAAYDLTPALTLLAQFNYYGWSRFKNVRMSFADGTEAMIEERYRNSWGVSFGAEYQLARAWRLRGGVQYDRTPTRDAFRSTRVPDTDRFWVALGASYKLSQAVAVDLSYAHLFARRAPINRTNSFPLLGTTVVTRGFTDTASDVFGINVRIYW